MSVLQKVKIFEAKQSIVRLLIEKV